MTYEIRITSEMQTALVEWYRLMSQVISNWNRDPKSKVKLTSENEGIDITPPIFSLIHVINRKVDEYVYMSTGIDFHKLVDEKLKWQEERDSINQEWH